MNGYHLIVRIGDSILPLTVTNLLELTVVQDMNRFLPELRMRVMDTTGALTHLLPFDKSMSTVKMEFGETGESGLKNSFSFAVFSRRPDGDTGNAQTVYDITGLLDVPGMFSPDWSRGHSDVLKKTLITIAEKELGVDATDISTSLLYKKDLVQPKWSNIQFLKHLKENIIGQNEECGYKCFIKCQKQKKIFVFKSLTEMIQEPTSYKFIVGPTVVEDWLPVIRYAIFDYYKLYEVFASKKQAYSYFNYDTSTFVQAEESVQDYQSLSDYWLIDKNDSENSNTLLELGRSNDFTSNFKGNVKSSYSNRLTGLMKMWVTTRALPSIAPGETVQILFPQGADAGGIYSYQHSGYWLIEKVVHNFGSVFLTKLLLTRNGVDTDLQTTLLKATKKKVA